MPDDKYKNTEAVRWRLVPEIDDDPLFPLNVHPPFPVAPAKKGGILAGRGKPPVRRGLNNPPLKLKEREAEERKKEELRNKKYLEKAKRQDRMS